MTGDVTKLITSRIFQSCKSIPDIHLIRSYHLTTIYLYDFIRNVCSFNVATAIPAAARLQGFVGPAPVASPQAPCLVLASAPSLASVQRREPATGNCTLWTKKLPYPHQALINALWHQGFSNPHLSCVSKCCWYDVADPSKQYSIPE